MVRLALSAVLSRPQLTLLAAQTQERVLGEERYRHTLDAIVRIYKTEGIPTFYRGMLPSLIGVSHIAVQFPLYEQLKVYYRAFSHLPRRPSHSFANKC